MEGQNALQIYRFIDGQPVLLGNTATASDNFNTGETWRIRLAFRGTTLMADLFNQFDELVARRVVTDPTFPSGFAGLRSGNATAYESFRLSGWAAPLRQEGLSVIVR